MTGSVLAHANAHRGTSSTLERTIDVVGLEQAESTPTLLADILREGRVLVDRDGLWEGLQGRRREIFAVAAREECETATNARRAVTAARARIKAQRQDPVQATTP